MKHLFLTSILLVLSVSCDNNTTDTYTSLDSDYINCVSYNNIKRNSYNKLLLSNVKDKRALYVKYIIGKGEHYRSWYNYLCEQADNFLVRYYFEKCLPDYCPLILRKQLTY